MLGWPCLCPTILPSGATEIYTKVVCNKSLTCLLHVKFPCNFFFSFLLNDLHFHPHLQPWSGIRERYSNMLLIISSTGVTLRYCIMRATTSLTNTWRLADASNTPRSCTRLIHKTFVSICLCFSFYTVILLPLCLYFSDTVLSYHQLNSFHKMMISLA